MSQIKDKYQHRYDQIMMLYDYADELAQTIDSQFADSASAQLKLVEPLIVTLEDSADVLTDEFINFVQKEPRRSSRAKIEKALRKIYTAIDDYKLRLHGNLKKVTKGIKNIADSIILAIKEKMEEVIVTFLHFTELSLDRVMHKHELEEIKRNQQHVFFQLHNLSQQH